MQVVGFILFRVDRPQVQGVKRSSYPLSGLYLRILIADLGISEINSWIDFGPAHVMCMYRSDFNAKNFTGSYPVVTPDSTVSQSCGNPGPGNLHRRQGR